MTLTLFDDIVRTDGRRSRYSEGRFAFLNRAAGEPFDKVRAVAEGWFAAYPVDGQVDLRARFRSKLNRVMSGAWWELYQHEAFRRLGYAITLHPDVAGTSRHPDFLVEDGKGSFYVELTFAGRSHAEDAAANRLDHLRDLVDALPVQEWWLMVEVEAEGPADPSTRALRRDLLAWLAALDPDAMVSQGDPDEVDRHAHVWRESGWVLRFRPLPKRVAIRGTGDGIIGSFSKPGGLIDTRGPLVKAVKDKASAYGTLDRPYVLAILFEHDFLDEEDLLNALFGSIAVRIPVDPAATLEAETVRLRDGAWLGPAGPTHTRVGGVLTAVNLLPWGVSRVAPHLWLNPWATRPIGSRLPWRTTEADPEEGTVDVRPATVSPETLFGLSADWPGDPYR